MPHDPLPRPRRTSLPALLGPGLAAVAALALIPPAPAAAQVDWAARASYERQVIDSELPGWSDWESGWIEGRRFWERGNVALQLHRSRRFGVTDAAAAVDGYADIASRTYVHAHLQIAPGARVRAEQDHRITLSHAVHGGWEGSLGYRFMKLTPTDAHILQAAVGRYLPGWYLRLRGSLNPSFEENATFASAAARRFLPSLDGFVEVSAGAGQEVVEVAVGPAVDIRGSRFASVRTELFPWSSVGVAGELSYHGLAELPTRVGIGASLIARW